MVIKGFVDVYVTDDFEFQKNGNFMIIIFVSVIFVFYKFSSSPILYEYTYHFWLECNILVHLKNYLLEICIMYNICKNIQKYSCFYIYALYTNNEEVE